MRNIPVISQSVKTFKINLQSVKSFKDSVIYNNNYAWIPLKPNSKEPLIRWRKYQKKTTSSEEGEKWFKRYKNINYGLITGKVNNLVVVDVDNDLEAIFQYEERLGSDAITTSVITNKGKHYYYSLNFSQVIKTQIINYSGIKLEIKGEGSYVVIPPSTIDGFTRYYYAGFECLKPLPDQLLALLTENRQPAPYKKPEPYKYKGKADCIKQILDRELKVGERQNSLYVLACLLYRAHNTKEVITSILHQKNQSITEPLSEEEIKAILSRVGKYGKFNCRAVNRLLPYQIQCANCLFNKKGGNEMINKEFINSLTDEEWIAFSLKRIGYSVKEIAQRRKVSERTIFNYLKSANDKQSDDFLLLTEEDDD